MLDYASKGIDGMDDDAGEEHAQNQPFTGRWTTTSSYDVYMVDTPKEGDGMMRRIQSRKNLPRYHQSVDVSGAALNRVAENTAIPAPKTMILRRTLKTKKTPSNQHPNRMIGRTGKLTLTSKQGTKTRRIITIYHSLRTM